MKIEPRSLLAPAVALLVFAISLQQTAGALQSSGVWRAPKPRHAGPKPVDPYATLDGILARPLLAYPTNLARDPFGFSAPAPVAAARPGPHRPVVAPPPPAVPVLTGIIWDADPRATIRFNQRDFSVRENSLFADFRVKSITSTQVVLDRAGESLVLTLRPKGE